MNPHSLEVRRRLRAGVAGPEGRWHRPPRSLLQRNRPGDDTRRLRMSPAQARPQPSRGARFRGAPPASPSPRHSRSASWASPSTPRRAPVPRMGKAGRRSSSTSCDRAVRRCPPRTPGTLLSGGPGRFPSRVAPTDLDLRGSRIRLFESRVRCGPESGVHDSRSRQDRLRALPAELAVVAPAQPFLPDTPHLVEVPQERPDVPGSRHGRRSVPAAFGWRARRRCAHPSRQPRARTFAGPLDEAAARQEQRRRDRGRRGGYRKVVA